MQADQILDRKGRDVATVGSDATVRDAIAALARHDVGALVICDDGAHIVGILSERDVVRHLVTGGETVLGQQVALLMQREVRTCAPSDSCDLLMEVMNRGHFRHVPVVDGDVLVGLVSMGDVVKARIDELDQERQALAHYIAGG